MLNTLALIFKWEEDYKKESHISVIALNLLGPSSFFLLKLLVVSARKSNCFASTNFKKYLFNIILIELHLTEGEIDGISNRGCI